MNRKINCQGKQDKLSRTWIVAALGMLYMSANSPKLPALSHLPTRFSPLSPFTNMLYTPLEMKNTWFKHWVHEQCEFKTFYILFWRLRPIMLTRQQGDFWGITAFHQSNKSTGKIFSFGQKFRMKIISFWMARARENKIITRSSFRETCIRKRWANFNLKRFIGE